MQTEPDPKMIRLHARLIVHMFAVLTQLLEGSLQILTQWIKEIPWRGFFEGLRNDFHLAVFSLNKSFD